MTRDFSKQRRDDQRSSSRNSHTGRYREERSSPPSRSHFNHPSADRAWKNRGSSDYRGGRNNSYGQPSRNNGQNRSQFDQPSAQYGHNRNRPYSNERPRYHSTEYRPHDSGNPRFNDRRREDYSERPAQHRAYRDNPRFNDRRREDYSERPASHRPYGDNPRYRDYGNQHRDRNGNRRNEYQERDRNENRRYGYQERDYDNRNRYPRDVDRNNRPPRSFDRSSRPYPSRGTRGPNTQNPRWQSRPSTQRGNSYSRPAQGYPRYRQQEEQFEGDYERFDAPETSPRPSRTGRFQDHPSNRHDQVANEPPEHPVTRLPDGRVLKGPRPVQRRNAQFWNEITNETESLIDSVHTPPAGQPAGSPEAPPAKQSQPKTQPQPSTPRTPRKRVASAVARGRKAGTRETGTKKKARSTGPKPSKRGYKWPTP